MFQRRGSKLCILLTIVLGVVAKPPPPPGAPWASFIGKPSPSALPWTSYMDNPVYSRSLGPPTTSGIGTINVPYMSKSPMFPKFVDPKVMISKKTDLLNNLFGGLGPVDNSGLGGDFPIFSKLGATNTFDKTQSTVPENAVPSKRGLFGPMMSPFAAMSGSMGPGGPMFNPMTPSSPMFNPMASKFGMMGNKFPFGGLGSMEADSYDSSDSSTRRRRSASEMTDDMEHFLQSISSEMTTENAATKDMGPPPAYPGLKTIAEEEEGSDAKTPLLKLFGPAASAGVNGYMPATFVPFSPVVDPGMLIAKKASFLDALFKNLATTTPVPMTTDIPIPKSTIVPADFWLPSSVIPGPTEYPEKVSKFLDKLFHNLALNLTLNATTPEDSDAASVKVARSVEDFTTISAAKDAIVDSILAELGLIKGSMVATMNDLIAYQKAAAASPIPKKPFKPFLPSFFAGSTPDTSLPFQQRMNVLSQVFDMLSELQKNITVAVQDAIKAQTVDSDEYELNGYGPMGGFTPYIPEPTPPVVNTTLLDAIKNKLSSISIPGSPAVSYPGVGFAQKKFARMVPKTPSSVWVSYPSSAASSKRETSEYEDYEFSDNNSHKNHNSRGVNMEMHQGYQSMPPGTIETVQAGGGSVPGHQGGGIKLLDSQNIGSKWAEWAQNIKQQYQGNRHHHNHH